MQTTLRVEGLSQFAKALRQLDGELPKLLRVAMNKAAGVVVDYGKARIAKRTGRAANTIRAQSTRTAVRVAEGSARAPYVPWLDFGGAVGRNRSVKRTFYKEGRYLYPALTDKKTEIEAALVSALDDVATKAGLELG